MENVGWKALRCGMFTARKSKPFACTKLNEFKGKYKPSWLLSLEIGVVVHLFWVVICYLHKLYVRFFDEACATYKTEFRMKIPNIVLQLTF